MPVTYRCGGFQRGICKYESDNYWKGRCPSCNRFYTPMRKGSDEEAGGATSLAMLGLQKTVYISTHQPEFDRVIGGGLVAGAPYVISGPNGTGKSTLLLTVSGSFASPNNPVLYTSGEERKEDVGALAGRINVLSEFVDVMGMNGDIYAITERAEEIKAKLLIIDSINTAFCDDVNSDEGSPSQMKAVANYLTAWCKRKSVPAIIIAHVDKAGDMAGPEAVKHLVDTVLELDPAEQLDDDGSIDLDTKDLVSLAVAKNRHGKSGEMALFVRSETGIVWKRKKSRLELV